MHFKLNIFHLLTNTSNIESDEQIRRINHNTQNKDTKKIGVGWNEYSGHTENIKQNEP